VSTKLKTIKKIFNNSLVRVPLNIVEKVPMPIKPPPCGKYQKFK
jgi:hypothetical protein